MNDIFNFNVPLDIVKSEATEKTKELRIFGYASTSDQDRQGDEIIQRGLDFSQFVDHGWINFDHDNSKIIGYPDKEKCHVDKHGFYVEALLIPDVPLAKSIWDTAVALKKSNAPRKLGFSVEGKVLKRNDLGQIVKAKIYNVAATYNPVNVNATFDALVKSFTNDQDDIEKALEAGHEGADTANGTVLIPESLDSAFKTLSYVIGDDEESKQHMLALKEKLSKRTDITKSELTLYFQLIKGLSFADSAALVDKITNSMEKTEV